MKLAVIVSAVCVGLTGCAHIPDYCFEAEKLASLRMEERLGCLEARMGNVEKKANVALGVGAVGVATGVVGVLGIIKMGQELKAAQATGGQ